MSVVARIALPLLLLVALASHGALPPRPLQHEDFDAWRSISAGTLSRDGRWLAYASMPLEGDGEVVVRELATGKEQRLPIGSLPPPPLTPADHNPERPAPRRDATLMITSDSRFLIVTQFPTQAERRTARRDPKGAPVTEGVIILDLAFRQVQRVTDVKSVQIPVRGGPWLALLQNLPAPQKATPSGRPGEPASPPSASPASQLILRRLDKTDPGSPDRVFPDVAEYTFSRDGGALVYTVSSASSPDQNGVYAIDPDATNPPDVLVSGPGRYRRLVWDRKNTQLIFLAERGGPTAGAPTWRIYHWKRGAGAAREQISSSTPGLPPDYLLSGEQAPSFSFTGESLQIWTAPAPKSTPAKPVEIDEEERVSADLWHWQDDFLQPMQQQRADQDRKRAYAARFDLVSGILRQVGDPNLPNVLFSADARRAFGRNDRAHRSRLDYEGPFHDLYLVAPDTGERRLVRERLSDGAATQWSPDGRWLAFYDQRQWFAIQVESGRMINLTSGIQARFDNELSDLPKSPPAYGAAGWTSDSTSFLIYDRFDLWQVFPAGGIPRNLTHGLGRATQTSLRVQNVSPRDPEDDRQGIDPGETLILRGESEVDRSTGYFRTSFEATTEPTPLLWKDKALQFVGRAADADVLLLTASRFDTYPDLHVTSPTFGPLTQVSHGNQQQEPFLWGTAELRTYRNLDGVELPSALFKPARFDPARKYPLIVYMYERLSQTVHTFVHPVPGTTINPSFYTSRGYAVLMPDIAYRVGAPGPSAMACILPAVAEVVREGWVDEAAIGLQGHSWGGYQTAYLITQTPRFRAAAAGAVVGNMTSAYSGISIGSGRTRQYKYESEQSRIGHPVYENPLPYLENSPVFHADRVRTPLLMLHNDGDDTVPWEQGVELFLALRRAGKEVYLFNYHHEFHGLRRRADQKDYARRLSQFFDHYLQGAPRPEWMEKGIPFLDRDAEKLRFRELP